LANRTRLEIEYSSRIEHGNQKREESLQHHRKAKMNLRQLLKKFYFVPGPSLNTAAEKNIGRVNQLMGTFQEPLLLNLGSGERFIGEKKLQKQLYKKIVKLDLFPYLAVDIVGDAHRLPFKDKSFHAVVCQAVLEHTENPFQVVEEMHRILKSGGIIYAEVPFMQGYHPTPGDFFRFSKDGSKRLFAKFSTIDLGVSVGPSSGLSWMLREYIAGFLSGYSEKKWARSISFFFSGWLTFPIKYGDLIFAKRPGAHRIASGFYYLGRKD